MHACISGLIVYQYNNDIEVKISAMIGCICGHFFMQYSPKCFFKMATSRFVGVTGDK